MTARVREIWANLAIVRLAPSALRRLALVATSAGTLVVVLAVVWWVQRPLYRPLFTNLTESDATAIVAVLRQDDVAHRLEDGGRAVLVPSDRLYELRLRLAARGLPQGGGVGFEIFDAAGTGQSDFLQHLNYQRALQGELARTITQLDGVESVRVHVAVPPRERRASRDRIPSASVVLKLRRGRVLGQEQVDGIVHLVASSVPGLPPGGVTVVDDVGRMLSAPPQETAPAGVSTSGLTYQRAIERQAEERIESLLGAVVGSGKVVARVAATVDLARTEREEELYDPEKTALASTETTREGRPDAAKSSGSERFDERQSYQVSRTRSRTVSPIGAVTQLSVAVLVDGLYRDEGGAPVFVPRSDEELEKLKSLVATAVGVSEARGDRIELASAPFQNAEVPGPAGVFDPAVLWSVPVVMRLLGLGVVIAALLVVVRPLMQRLAAVPAPGRRAFRGVFLDRETAVSDLAQENLSLAQQNPERAAQLVRQWLLENGQKPV